MQVFKYDYVAPLCTKQRKVNRQRDTGVCGTAWRSLHLAISRLLQIDNLCIHLGTRLLALLGWRCDCTCSSPGLYLAGCRRGFGRRAHGACVGHLHARERL